METVAVIEYVILVMLCVAAVVAATYVGRNSGSGDDDHGGWGRYDEAPIEPEPFPEGFFDESWQEETEFELV
jgi:hypothetical protein